MTVTQITRLQSAPALDLAFSRLTPDSRHEIPVRAYPNQPLPLAGSGIALHEALDQHNRHGWCSPDCYPYIRELRSWLDSSQVQRVLTEWSLNPATSNLTGQCDALLIGGVNRFGLLELKIRADLPAEPRPEDCFQLGEYTTLLASERNCSPAEIWLALVYCSPCTHTLRLFTWQEATQVAQSAAACLAYAA